jgi:hypothetical protein
VLNATNAGDPAYQNPTTIATVLTIGASGGRVENVYIQPAGTNAATSIRFFIDTVGSGGTNNRIIHDTQLTASTSITTSALYGISWSPGLVLPANSVLRATLANTAVTNGIVVSVEYGEF